MPLLLGVWLASACRPPGEEVAGSSSARVVSASAPVSAVTSAAPSPSPSVDARAVLAPLQGRFRVQAASEGRGHVFAPLVGQIVTIDGDTLKMPEAPGSATEVRKTIVVVGTEGPIFHIDLVHRGHFNERSSVEEDQRARTIPNSKGWGRVGSAKAEGQWLWFSLEFPQNPRPRDFTEADSREIVKLERVEAP